jgi:prepilin signal peptidase PulO-like enzyme (type II secretory pathway)
MLLGDVFMKSVQLYGNLSAGIISFLIFYAVFMLSGGIGFGDVKLAGLLGYAVGLDNMLSMCLVAALFCMLVYIPGIYIFRWNRMTKLPFAPFLSAGAVTVITSTLPYGGY